MLTLIHFPVIRMILFSLWHAPKCLGSFNKMHILRPHYRWYLGVLEQGLGICIESKHFLCLGEVVTSRASPRARCVPCTHTWSLLSLEEEKVRIKTAVVARCSVRCDFLCQRLSPLWTWDSLSAWPGSLLPTLEPCWVACVRQPWGRKG